MYHAALVWVCLMVLFVIVEANTVDLVSIWFAVGALVATVAALLNCPVWGQIILFFAVAAVLLACLRPLVRKYIKPNITATNIDALIGATGYVTSPIDNEAACGTVKLGAMEWTARSSSKEPIPAGTLVKVDRIEGVKVFVSTAER